jgi:crossover junction endodeoxyribonuclease RuvC
VNPIIGIDPGIEGALALLDGDELRIEDMPAIGDGSKRRVDHAQLAVILDGWSMRQGVRAYIERVASMPGNGHAGAFSFGRSTGVVIGAVAANFIPLQEVTPQVWKRVTGTPKDKDGAGGRVMGALQKALAPQSSYAAKKTDLWPSLLERLTDCVLPADLEAFEAELELREMEIPGAWREPLAELIEKRREEIEQDDIALIMRNNFDF